MEDGFNIEVTEEEIRGGEIKGMLDKYFHVTDGSLPQTLEELEDFYNGTYKKGKLL